jgi:hypothetical protein
MRLQVGVKNYDFRRMPHQIYLSLTDTLHPPPSSKSFSLRPLVLPIAFLPERIGVGSVDWPPIESTLVPEGRNVEQDNGVGVQVSNILRTHL